MVYYVSVVDLCPYVTRDEDESESEFAFFDRLVLPSETEFIIPIKKEIPNMILRKYIFTLPILLASF